MQTCRGYCIVPVGHILANYWRPSRRSIFVQVVHDEHIDRFACQGTSYTNRLKAALVAYNLALIGVAGVVAASSSLFLITCLTSEERLWKQFVLAVIVHDALEFAVELTSFGSIVGDNGNTLIRILS